MKHVVASAKQSSAAQSWILQRKFPLFVQKQCIIAPVAPLWLLTLEAGPCFNASHMN